MSRLTARFHFAAFRNLFPVAGWSNSARLFVFFFLLEAWQGCNTERCILLYFVKGRDTTWRLVRHTVVILGATILNLSPVWNVRARHRRPVARKFKRRGGWIGYGVHCWLVTAFKGCLPAWKDHNLSRGALGLPWLEDCAHLFCSANWRRQVLNTKLQKNQLFCTIRRRSYISCIRCELFHEMRTIYRTCMHVCQNNSKNLSFSRICLLKYTITLVPYILISLRYDISDVFIRFFVVMLERFVSSSYVSTLEIIGRWTIGLG